MTEIKNPFSQFNAQYAPMYKSNNTPIQNNVAPKEQTVQLDKKQFNYRDLLIPIGGASVGSIGGFAIARLNKNIKIKNIDGQIKEYKTELLKKFNEDSDVKSINDNIQRVNVVLKTIKENGIDYIEKVLPNEKSPKKIASLKESLKKLKEAKEYQEATLDKLNTDLKTKFTNLVEKPLKEFMGNLADKTAQYNKIFTKKAAIIGTLIGFSIGLLILCVKNRQKEDRNEDLNAVF